MCKSSQESTDDVTTVYDLDSDANDEALLDEDKAVLEFTEIEYVSLDFPNIECYYKRCECKESLLYWGRSLFCREHIDTMVKIRRNIYHAKCGGTPKVELYYRRLETCSRKFNDDGHLWFVDELDKWVKNRNEPYPRPYMETNQREKKRYVNCVRNQSSSSYDIIKPCDKNMKTGVKRRDFTYIPMPNLSGPPAK